MNRNELSTDDPVYRIVGCAMEVLNSIGHGLREKTYERALMVEFDHQGLEYETQRVFPVFHRDELVDEFIPDLIVDGEIVVDATTVDVINNDHIGQMLNYLKITGLKTGLLVNFKHARLQWRKVTLNESND